jgi:SsrA-binding protein
MSKTGAAKGATSLIVKNRRATFDFHVERLFEAGLELLGTEVKSLREGQVNLADSYAQPDKGQLFLLHCNIAPYKASGPALNHAPMRPRRLLLNRREIDDITSEVAEKGLTLVPMSLYWKDGRAKVELGLCRGKTHGDRREAIQERETRREMDRAMRGAKRVRHGD